MNRVGINPKLINVAGTSMNVEITSPLESNGAIPVNAQDQTSEPIDSLFNQSISNFDLSADTVESTEMTLEYTFIAEVGHSIILGDEILLLDIDADRVLQAVVTGVAVNTIMIDRPIDHVFLSATALGRRVTSNMVVDGSITPQIFTFRAGIDPVDITRLFLTMIGDNTTMDDGKFGNLAALSNGLVLRIYDGLNKTIFNFKTNRDIKQFCYDVQYSDNAPAGNTGLTARISFGGQEKHGVVLRVSGMDVIQWIVQDNLTGAGLISLSGSVQGHKVTD